MSFYSATLSVKPAADGGSEVEWDARFYAPTPAITPPETQNDQAAIAAMTSSFTRACKA